MGWKREIMLRRMYAIYIIVKPEALKTGDAASRHPYLPRGTFLTSWNSSSALPRGASLYLAELHPASRSPCLPRGASLSWLKLFKLAELRFASRSPCLLRGARFPP